MNFYVGALAALLTLSQPVNEYSLEDAQLMMRTAQAEAGNQGEDGMWLVMSVIENRVESEDFPNTVKEVVYQDGQFATAESGAIDKVEVSNDCHIALARIEKGEVAKSVIAFENKRSNSLDKYFSSAFVYRDHRFYTPKIN